MTALEKFDGARVVVTNWRDLKHPSKGGAEVFCHQVAEHFAAAGAQVELLTASSDGNPAGETMNGVRVHRLGNALTVYPRALLWILRRRKSIDAIIDCQNGIPFFTPLTAARRTPIVCVIHHVHQQQFGLYLPRPAAWLARQLEGRFTRRVYGRRAFAVVSPSTRTDARRVLQLKGSLHVTPSGIERPERPVQQRATTPRLVSVGRLVPHKRVEILLEALPAVREAHPQVHLDVVGDGPARPALQRRAAELGIEDLVTFHGFVSEEDRRRLVADAWATAITSTSEGWGLTVIEAAALGVPAVGLDVPGVRDSIRDEETGWLVRDREGLAPALIQALERMSDPAERELISNRTERWAAGFSWLTTADLLARALLAERDRLGRVGNDRRGGSDVGIRIEIPRHRVELEQIAQVARRTDRWTADARTVSVLLPGADETTAIAVLHRLGLTPDAVEMQVARPLDFMLGNDHVVV
jgi:glycosyltransferase involved in cell wall biosynthesis